MRTLDDVYGPDLDDFPLEQEAAAQPARLDWREPAARPDPRRPAWVYGPVRGPLRPQSSDRFTAFATRR